MTFRIIHATIFQRGAIAIIKISACVITKNEEKNIQQWLDCVKEFSDEIIVVDTGSEDRTVELARAGGATVYHFAWCNDFSAAKNYALDQATGDWIVFLDADEYFGDSIKAKFRATLELIHGNQTILGIDSLLYNIDADHNNEIKSTANQKRIFRNMKQLRYQGRIHEYLAYSGKKAMGFAYSEKFAIYHTGYSQSLTISKNQRNLDMLLADIEAEGGEKPTHYSYLSVSYFNLQQYDKAIHYAKLAVEAKNKGIKSAFVKQYWIWIRSEQMKHASSETLQKIVDAALEDVPGHPDFLWEDAKLALQQRNFLLAEQRLVQVLEQVKNEELMREYESGISNQFHIIYAALGKIRVMQGRTREAADFYKKSLQENPYKENVLRDLLRLLSDQKPKKIIQWMDTIYDRNKDRSFLTACLMNRIWDDIYLYYVCPVEGSYEELMGRKAYREAAENTAKALAPILAGANSQSSPALVSQATRIGRILMLSLLYLPTKDFLKCTQELSVLPEGIRHCLLRFHGDEHALSAEDADTFHDLMNNIWQYGSPELVDRFALLAKELGEQDILKTAEELCQNCRWETALALYRHIPYVSNAALPAFYYHTGLCHFFRGEKEKALDCLTKAQLMDAAYPDLCTYIAWCQKSYTRDR